MGSNQNLRIFVFLESPHVYTIFEIFSAYVRTCLPTMFINFVIQYYYVYDTRRNFHIFIFFMVVFIILILVFAVHIFSV